MGRPKKSAGGQPADSANAGAPDAGVADAGAPSAAPSWKLTEDLLKTLNQELGGLKEYVLADLRGEITSLRSKKLQLETDINRLQSRWDSLVSDRDRAQQQQWAQQFSQVMAQNLRQDLQAQLLGTDAAGTERPEQRLLVLREQIAGLESVLGGAIAGVRHELGRHESALSQQVMRMETLEQQGEAILSRLVERLQASGQGQASGQTQASAQPIPTPRSQGLSPISFTLGSTSTTGIAASLRSRTEETGPVSAAQTSVVQTPANPVPTPSAPDAPAQGSAQIPAQIPDQISAQIPAQIPAQKSVAAAIEPDPALVINAFPADVLFGSRAASPPVSKAAVIPPFDSDSAWVASDSPPKAPPIPPVPPVPPRPNPSREAEVDPEDPSAPFVALPPPDSLEEVSPRQPTTPLAEETFRFATSPQEAISPPSAASSPAWVAGFISAGLSLILLALQYCTVQLIFHGAPWLGTAGQGFIQPTWGSALLTFWIRMLMVLPLMIVIGHGIYPPLLEEMQEVVRSRDRRPLISIVLSSLLLFLSQLLLYRSIGISSASVAVGLLFVYPAAVNLFGVGLFKRPISRQALLTLLPIGLGGMILLVQSGSAGVNPGGLSAICFALYVLVGRLYTRHLHLLTLTVMQFGLAWLFSMPALLFLRQASPAHEVGYVVACLVLSLTVFLNYFFNTASLNRLGPAWSSIVNGWTPLLVALLSMIFSLGSLTLAQGLGILLVTLGVTALNLERSR